MLTGVKLKNFGPLRDIDWQNLGWINLVIGSNGSGKTFLLKALYSAIRTIEEFGRGDDKRTAEEILAYKLDWTYQPEKIGDIVSKGSNTQLSFDMQFTDKNRFKYRFGKDTTKQITHLQTNFRSRSENSVFLPSKEVLTIQHIVDRSRWDDRVFGFDDTYYDLARALRLQPYGNRPSSISERNRRAHEKTQSEVHENHVEYSSRSKSLPGLPINEDTQRDIHQMFGELLAGKFEYDESGNKWIYKKGNEKYVMGLTAEGMKKLATLDILLRTSYIGKGSIIFIDEPESNLHPKAISDFLDILHILARNGIQFFLASHSYFVMKKLYLIAQEHNMSIPVLSLSGDEPTYHDLKNGLPDNSIIDESIRLYKEEMKL